MLRRGSSRARIVLLAIAAMTVIAVSVAAAAIGDGQLGGPTDPPNAVPASTMCPLGSVARGATGDTADLPTTVVDILTLTCTGAAPAIGTIGTPNGDETPASTGCAPGQVAVGISGREGNF